jgi:hypothetical protein
MTDPTPNAPVPKPPSPAAQAVLTAFAKASDGEYIDGEWQQNDVGQLAAALCAAADQVAPSDAVEPRNYLPAAIECQRIREELLVISTELKGFWVPDCIIKPLPEVTP